MKKILLLVLLSPLFSLANGGVVGNGGGDLVYCTPWIDSPWHGYYNLDFLTVSLYNDQSATEFESVVGPKAPFDKNILRILKVTKYKYPSFHESLKEFYDHLLKDEVGTPFRWKKAPHGLSTVEDENLRILLPPNCVTSKRPILQAITRYRSGDHFDLFYSPDLLEKIANRPMQKSFLFFHEWLRGLTDDPEVIRNANALLHGKDWTLPQVETRMLELAKAGLNRGPFDIMPYGLLEINIYDDKIKVIEDGTIRTSTDHIYFFKRRPKFHFVIHNFTNQKISFVGQSVAHRHRGFEVPANGKTQQVVNTGETFNVMMNKTIKYEIVSKAE